MPDSSQSKFIELSNSIQRLTMREFQQGNSRSHASLWRKLRTTTLEIELSLHRLRSALNQLNTPLPEEASVLFSMSKGAWVEYQEAAITIWMYKLLDCERALVCQIVRNLIKPCNTDYKNIEKSLLIRIDAQKERVAKLRNPQAHAGAGGPIEQVMEDEKEQGNLIVIPSPIDFNQILGASEPYQSRWYFFLNKSSQILIAELDNISKELNEQVNWNKFF